VKEAAVQIHAISTLFVLVLLSPIVAIASDRIVEQMSGATQTSLLADDPGVQALLRDLLKKAGYGHRTTERAAFLVIDARGEYQCLLWPFHHGFAKERFRGRVPPFTIAVAHTHPNSVPLPSAQDEREAGRLGLPFLVVSLHDIYTVTPEAGGQTSTRTRWSEGNGGERELRCQRLPAER
jgi:hypothetical protein